MVRIDLDEIFFDFITISERYVPEADQLEMCVELLRELKDKGHNIQVLHGYYDIVDDAFEELDDNFESDDEEDENY